MDFPILIKGPLRNLRRAFLRSGLTALGITIGVAAVVAMVSIGDGARARVETTIAGMDNNELTIIARAPRDDSGSHRAAKLRSTDGLRLGDYSTIQREVRWVRAFNAQTISQNNHVEAYGRSMAAQVVGFDVGGFAMRPGALLRGAYFGAADVQKAATVCLITETVANTLFQNRDPIGKAVRVNRFPYVVVGVLTDYSPPAADPTVVVPYTSVLRRMDRTAPLSITLKATTPAYLVAVQEAVSDLLERRRGNRVAEFVTGNVDEAIRLHLETSRTMTLLLGSIAGISLLVGGIGIMNIMLVSVKQRTREIGIRMAIGTRSRDVLRQFLVEAMILSLLGGSVGIVLGAGAAHLLSHFNDWPTRITPESILTAFLFSAVVGIFFGYYPARQAARLDPIQALRSE